MTQQPGQTPVSDVPIESAALSRITWYAILQIVATAGGFVTYLLYLPEIFSTFSTLTPGTAPSPGVLSNFLQGLFTYLMVIFAVTLILELVGVFLLWGTLRRLSKVDSLNFSTPATLTIPLFVGLVMVGVGIVPLFWMISTILSQAVQNPASNVVLPSVIGFFLAVGLIFIGGILALIGIIGGAILGLWRVGARYNATTIKIGAIFIVIPFLNWVGPILVLIGALDAKNRLRR